MDKNKLRALIARGATDAKLLINMNMDVSCLRTNDTLLKDEWITFDTAIIKAARDRLVGIMRLRAKGLVHTVGNGLGKTVLEYEDASDMEAAQISMDGITRGRNDRVEFDIKSLPLPIIHKDYQLGIRPLNASRTMGETLDTTLAEQASRRVADLMEQHMFQGTSSFTYSGATITGLEDAANRNTGILAAAWNATAATGTTIIEDVKSMKQANIDAKHFGPYDLWVPTNFEVALDNDYVDQYPMTRRERILAIGSIEVVTIADKMTASNVILVQMTTNVIRQVEGLPITNLEWTTEGGMVFHFKVMTISVTQIRADQDGNSGVAHFTV